jgi:hypothetical protein
VVKKVLVRTLADRKWIRVVSINKPLFLALLPGASQFTSFGFASNFVLDLAYRLFANI